MGLILNIETATKVCSIALGNNGQLVDFIDILEDGYSHSEKLNLSIIDLLKRNELSINNLDSIAISEGPGSYTGLRIGTASAKGFCFGKNIPLIAVNTLEALGNMASIEKGVKIPLIDARRMEVFGGVFGVNNEEITHSFNYVIEQDSFAHINEDKHLFGNGAEKLKEFFLNKEGYSFINNIECSARGMVGVSERKYKNEEFEDVAYFEPNYGKEFYTVPSKK
ncbi:tRNA (adenosine(37)-N6)-threonylcarbamoyltransferase complex dimerization subunit type 1 TsaB [bacterium]|nr:tRNA (adenosine(37)-N6)-threonylcarbamoyltransferase complex dimerization subunit type 1 TsaB [bacterium]